MGSPSARKNLHLCRKNRWSKCHQILVNTCFPLHRWQVGGILKACMFTWSTWNILKWKNLANNYSFYINFFFKPIYSSRPIQRMQSHCPVLLRSIRKKRVILLMHLSMPIWRGRAGNPQDSDIGDLLHPSILIKHPRHIASLGGSVWQMENNVRNDFPQGLPRGFWQGSSALGDDFWQKILRLCQNPGGLPILPIRIDIDRCIISLIMEEIPRGGY